MQSERNSEILICYFHTKFISMLLEWLKSGVFMYRPSKNPHGYRVAILRSPVSTSPALPPT